MNVENGKVYIGQSKNIEHRWYCHVSSLKNNHHYNTYLQNAWNKYGEEAFKFYIVETCDLSELDEREIHYIAKYRSSNSNFGYNLTAGGNGTHNAPLETRKKMSESIKRHYENNPEKRELTRQNTLKQFADPEFYKKYRELRSSEEYRKKISEAHKGFKVSEETKRKISKNSGKKVICIETGIVFNNIAEAERSLPGNKNIKSVVTGRRKTAGGYHWAYYNENYTAA